MANSLDIIKAFSIISTVPALLIHAGILETEVTHALKNPLLIAELKANPIVKAHVDQISKEWRAVENDATAVKKSHIFTAIPAVLTLIKAAGVLEKDIQSTERDPAITASLASMPAMKAELEAISAQWRAVENDLGALKP